jgi:hypothetical protein
MRDPNDLVTRAELDVALSRIAELEVEICLLSDIARLVFAATGPCNTYETRREIDQLAQALSHTLTEAGREALNG